MASKVRTCSSPKDDELSDGRLRKGQTVDGWLTYEFAKGVKSVTLACKDGMFADTEHVWIINR
jgi:hypothetical protein